MELKEFFSGPVRETKDTGQDGPETKTAFSVVFFLQLLCHPRARYFFASSLHFRCSAYTCVPGTPAWPAEHITVMGALPDVAV